MSITMFEPEEVLSPLAASHTCDWRWMTRKADCKPLDHPRSRVKRDRVGKVAVLNQTPPLRLTKSILFPLAPAFCAIARGGAQIVNRLHRRLSHPQSMRWSSVWACAHRRSGAGSCVECRVRRAGPPRQKGRLGRRPERDFVAFLPLIPLPTVPLLCHTIT